MISSSPIQTGKDAMVISKTAACSTPAADDNQDGDIGDLDTTKVERVIAGLD